MSNRPPTSEATKAKIRASLKATHEKRPEVLERARETIKGATAASVAARRAEKAKIAELEAEIARLRGGAK